MSPDSIITWTTAFAPSVWAAGAMTNDTFDYLVQELESHEFHSWPPELCTALRTLAYEDPLHTCPEYGNFIKCGT